MKEKLLLIACLFMSLNAPTANATAHVIYLDDDGMTVYIGSDSLRPMNHGPTSVCKSVSNGNTVIVLFGKTTNTHEDGTVDHSFYAIADEILRRPETLDQKFADLKQAGPSHLKALIALHPEWKNEPPALTVLQVAMVGFINGRPKLWSYDTHVVDWDKGPEPPVAISPIGSSFKFYVIGHGVTDGSKYPRPYPGGPLKLVNDVLDEEAANPGDGVGKPFTVIKLTERGAEQVQDEMNLCSVPRKGQ
jgi:hypothetical protein